MHTSNDCSSYSYNRTRKNTVNMAIALLICFILACKCGDVGNNNNRNSNNSNSTSNSNNENKKKPNTKANQDKGDFIVSYPGVENMKYQELDASIKQQKILENAASQLNAALILPRDITLSSRDCGQPNAFYQPDKHTLYICYELMELFYDVFKRENMSDEEANKRMFNAIQFVFLHELGHSLIHNYDLGVTGKEEDAVDQLATYISTEEVENGEDNALNGALTFILLSKNQDATKLPYYDEHSLGPQRFYNILCWLYGHNPQKYQYLVTEGTLPEPRAVRCNDEYTKFTKYWKRELKPFRKNLNENESENNNE